MIPGFSDTRVLSDAGVNAEHPGANLPRFWYPRTCERAASARELLYESIMANTLELLQLLGKAWVTTLTCLTGDQWQLRIESHPAPRWDEYFAYTYRGSLASVVARAYAGETDDGEEQAAA